MKITKAIELNFTPHQIAELFCELDGDEQAEFFSAIHLLASGWGGTGWCGQALSIAEVADERARNVITTLYQHIEETKP